MSYESLSAESAPSKVKSDLNITFSWKKSVIGQNPFSTEKAAKAKPVKRKLTKREHGIWQSFKDSGLTIKSFCAESCFSVRQFEKIKDKVDSIGFDDENCVN